MSTRTNLCLRLRRAVINAGYAGSVPSRFFCSLRPREIGRLGPYRLSGPPEWKTHGRGRISELAPRRNCYLGHRDLPLLEKRSMLYDFRRGRAVDMSTKLKDSREH
jgi:hypothetical protein